MRFEKRVVLSVLAVLLVGSMAVHTTDAKNEEEEVQAAIDQFYAALDEMFKGNIEPMLDVWSHKNDVTYLGPLGDILVGWDAVKASWEAQAAMMLGGQVKTEHQALILGKDLAVSVSHESGVNTNVDGKVRAVSLRATNTFRKEGGKWKMVGHHTDMFPED